MSRYTLSDIRNAGIGLKRETLRNGSHGNEENMTLDPSGFTKYGIGNTTSIARRKFKLRVRHGAPPPFDAASCGSSHHAVSSDQL